MFIAHNIVTINCPVGEVFAYVANPSNIPRWRTNTVEVLDVRLPIGVGSTYTLIEQAMGRRLAGQRVCEFEPNRLIVIETTSGTLRPVQRFTFEATSTGGTVYDARLDVTTSGIMRLLEPFMRGTIQKTMGTYGENLKRNLET